MKFPLRYWTRRSALTVAAPATREAGAMCNATTALRARAAEHGWLILGEAFLRIHGDEPPAMHLPVYCDAPLPLSELPDIQVGRIEYGPVVAAFDVTPPDAPYVAETMLAELARAGVSPGPAEFHFDPSVGRSDGLLVVPVAQHPADKSAFISVRRPVAG